MKKLHNWFIGGYLAKTDNVFERAKINLLYSLLLFYLADHVFFMGNLIPNHYYYHLVLISTAALTYLVLLYMLRKNVSITVIAKVVFYQGIITGTLSYLVQQSHMDLIGEFWMIVSILITFFTLDKRYGLTMAGIWFLQIVYCSVNDLSGGKFTLVYIPADQVLPPAPPFVLIPYFLCVYIIYQFVKTRSLAEVDIQQQKKLIELKNTEITDSINYALRIQQAQLPDKKEIYTHLPDSFILFKPKDIVSGDFYFFQKKGDLLFIAAADCTGHGVPGALMSMLGSEKLNEAVLQSSDTSEILTRLNKGIKTSLRQSAADDATRDGMDIALCRIKLPERIVSYAAANRPIWIIRKGQKEVEEIKATKKAIGGFTDDNQHFDTHEIKLQPGDTFYIFTDGYADTFGGPNGKKFSTKKFRQLLIDIQGKSMQEQGKHLGTFIDEWKAAAEFIDDILVIGVRI
ncbi:MAG TPA: SpoIIE family protein phosphatase [Bacteroidia bacterium]|nr:SpoIIE family protein phosphatase [Bacteroidia bacterium]